MRQFAEKQHTQMNCITFGSLQFGHASLIRLIPSFASPAKFWSAYFDQCDNVYLHEKLCLSIKNLGEKVIYILIVALQKVP